MPRSTYSSQIFCRILSDTRASIGRLAEIKGSEGSPDGLEEFTDGKAPRCDAIAPWSGPIESEAGNVGTATAGISATT